MFNGVFIEILAVHEIMWKHNAEPYRPQMTIWRMRIVCWIPKPTTTHSEYVTIIAFPLQQLLNESAPMLPYTYVASLVTTKEEHHVLTYPYPS
jgi:hypothetical protein